MLKATVHYGPQELGLQQKVPEARAVDGNVGPLDIFLGGWGVLSAGAWGSSSSS